MMSIFSVMNLPRITVRIRKAIEKFGGSMQLAMSRVVSANEQAYGEKGVYNVDQGIFVLTGKVRLDTSQERVTATRSLEYWVNKNMAVARGNAIAIHEDRRLNGETLVAYFHAPDANGKTKASAPRGPHERPCLDAYGNHSRIARRI